MQKNFKRKTKLIDCPSPFAFSLEGALVHNPYVGTFHRGRQLKKDPMAHNPYVGTRLHSPRSQSCSIKSLIEKPSYVPFITQLQLIKEKNLNCAHLSRESLEGIMTITYSNEKLFDRDRVHNICAICLEEFDDGHLLRLLPNCKHAFHKNCVDSWLEGTFSEEDSITSFCPTCRRNAVIADSMPSSPGIDIPSEVFMVIGSLLASEYMKYDHPQEIEVDELVPCITLDSSEYSTCGFPLTM